MNKIRILGKEDISKIAAGEVIINPASVVKELVENSLDAGSSIIRVFIQNGGKTLIRVTDNGCGIPKDEVDLAFLRNSTSKFERIDEIKTLGFRGEALASISVVAKVTITTKTDGEEIAVSNMYIDTKRVSSTFISARRGTMIEIRDLFYNMPVRYKHLKRSSDETSYIIDTVRNAAASRPDVSFELNCDGKGILMTSGDNDTVKTLSLLFGKDIIDAMINIDFQDEPLFVKGFVMSPAFLRAKEELKLLILNGRVVLSPILTKTIDSVYTELFGKRGAGYIFYINLPYNMIDVNIHPAKTTVGFLNETLIMMIIKQGLKDGLKKEFVISANKADFTQIVTPFESNIDDVKQNELTDETEIIEDRRNNVLRENDAFVRAKFTQNVDSKSDNSELFSREQGSYSYDNTAAVKTFFSVKEEPQSFETIKRIDFHIFEGLFNAKYIGMAFGLYALFEYKNNVYAIDTHAADERVIYEKYLNAFNKREVEAQPLLVPVIITVDIKERYTLIENSGLLLQAGFDSEVFDEESAVIRSIPIYLTMSKDIGKRFLEVLDIISDTSETADLNARNTKLIKCACHDAFRGSSNISEQELRELIKELSQTEMPFTCPHGRPIIGKLNITAFMRAFERI